MATLRRRLYFYLRGPIAERDPHEIPRALSMRMYQWIAHADQIARAAKLKVPEPELIFSTPELASVEWLYDNTLRFLLYCTDDATSVLWARHVRGELELDWAELPDDMDRFWLSYLRAVR